MSFEVSTPEEVFREAGKHGHMFLIGLHAKHGDPRYDACKSLVESGHARWLTSSSTYYPGIRLTGKPWDSER